MTAPVITWVNVGSDGPDYMLAAKYLRVAHPTGEPFYTLLGAAWIRVIPFGTEWFRYALMSAVFSAATAALIWHATRNLLGPAFYLSSGIVVSQSTILELYAPVTFFMVLGWYLHNQKRPAWGYAMIGLALAIHHLAGFMWIALMLHDWFTKDNYALKRAPLAVLVGLPWYAYIPLANRPPYISVAGPDFGDYVKFFGSQTSLLGGMAIMVDRFTISEDLRERTWDLVRILLGGFGPVLILAILGVQTAFKTGQKLLPILSLAIMIYWFTDLDPRVYTYTMPVFALMAIVIARVQGNWHIKSFCAVFIVFALAFNVMAYDIGDTVDPNHSAAVYYETLGELEPNAVVWSQNRGWEKMTAVLHNFNEGTEIDTVTTGGHSTSVSEVRRRLDEAYKENRLYQTIVTSPAHYDVTFIRTTPQRVFEEAKETDVFKGERWKY